MIEAYTSEEIRSELKRFGLTQQWLAGKSKVTRQYVCGILGDKKWLPTVSDDKKELYKLLWTYILKDYEADILRARQLPLLKPKRLVDQKR